MTVTPTSTKEANPDSYREIPYPRYSYPETHPARIAAVSHLFGVKAPDIKGARILELGCAVGGNALALAAALPESQVVAVDKSATQISAATEIASAAGLHNVRFECSDVADLTASLGSFDYCIAHGLLSWMELSKQPMLLQKIEALLKPQGVAYVSFNTLPGWYARRAVRDLMLFHTRKTKALTEKVQRAREVLAVTADALKHTNSSHGKYLQEEIAFVHSQPDGYLAHDHLEQDNNPLYFSDFLRFLSTTKLRYLSDISLATMWPAEFPPKVQGRLTALAASGAELEQYLDFVRNRTFRQSLLVKSSTVETKGLSPEALNELCLGFPLWRVKALDDGMTSFRDDTGTEMRVKEPHVSSLLSSLAAHWPAHLPFQAILQEARTGMHAKAFEKHNVEELLLQCVMRGLVTPQIGPVHDKNVGDRLKISKLALTEARRDGLVVNQLLHRFQLTPRMRAFFLLLDDAPTLDQLAKSLDARIERLLKQTPELKPGFDEIAAAKDELLPKGMEFLKRNAFLLAD